MNADEYFKKREELFKRWKKEYEGKHFSCDGISNYEAWGKSKPKILFLLKENHANDWEPL
jgi:hypothetical protein